MIGADTVISGSVTEFGRRSEARAASSASTKLQLAKAKVDIRLVGREDGPRLLLGHGSGEASTESGEIAGFGSRAEYDATLNDRAIAAASSDVVDRLVDRLLRPSLADRHPRGSRDQVFISAANGRASRPATTAGRAAGHRTAKSKQSGFGDRAAAAPGGDREGGQPVR